MTDEDVRKPADLTDWILAESQRHLTAKVQRDEAEAREWLTERVYDAIFPLRDHTTEQAEAAVEVFVEFLRNPPVREIQLDGTEVVRWP